MTEYSRKSGRWFAIACIAVMLIFFTMIVCRGVTRQIVVKKLGITNDITAAIFFDAPQLNELPKQVTVNNTEEKNGTEEKNINIDWQEKYPFGVNEVEKIQNRLLSMVAPYKARAAAVKKPVEDYAGQYFPGRVLLTNAAKKQDILLYWKYGNGSQKNGVLFMHNGYLTFWVKKIGKKDMEEIADSLAAFQGWLKKRNISLLYVNNGYKVNPFDRQLSLEDRLLENTNANSDALQRALRLKGVSYIDMRQEMRMAGLDWYASYYRTDHHWKTQTGMWAAGVLAERLNSQYGFSFDKKFFDEANYQADTYTWKGSQWRSAHATLGYDCPREEYTYFFPKFSTFFSVEIPTRGIVQKGKYEDTLFDVKHMVISRGYSDADLAEKENAYCNVTWRNDAVGIFKNLQPVHNKKKMLFLQDSFSFYLTTYLACDVAEIHVINPLLFTGSIRAYVEAIKPDMVIVACCSGNIREIDWGSHTSFFDFR